MFPGSQQASFFPPHSESLPTTSASLLDSANCSTPFSSSLSPTFLLFSPWQRLEAVNRPQSLFSSPTNRIRSEGSASQSVFPKHVSYKSVNVKTTLSGKFQNNNYNRLFSSEDLTVNHETLLCR